MRDGTEARDELTRCREAGVMLVSRDSGCYPPGLNHLHQPPLLLCVRGRWPLPKEALAIVGARAATPYGRAVAGELAEGAAGDGLAIVSGLARGIDRFALEAAADTGGWPIAILGCGLGVVYPPEHGVLQERIARHGTLLSEFPLAQHPTRGAFPRRNRIIAAVADAVLVVEAGERSGSLITAGYALELGRDVLAVPGPIDGPQSRGANRLIADGAAPVLGVSSLLRLLGRATATDACGGPTSRSKHSQAGADASDPGEPVGAETGKPSLLVALGRRVLTVDELAAACGAPAARVRAELVALELEGRVQPHAGGRWQLRRS